MKSMDDLIFDIINLVAFFIATVIIFYIIWHYLLSEAIDKSITVILLITLVTSSFVIGYLIGRKGEKDNNRTNYKNYI